ncbi:virulence associated lipoprotein [Borreliella valaisiana]|uniref:virulence associated lipoprotein n=1 Tax=Borreliella valaisiana TaxID=62088 RepID=UPI002ED08FB8|nr:virulence associated lipoprotein [Borreliella valaisiana]
MSIFDFLDWGEGQEKASANTDRSIRYRRHSYTFLSRIDDSKLKEFSDIIVLTENATLFFNIFNKLGGVLNKVADYLYSKKDTLNNLNISDLEKIKESCEKILSIIKSVSETSKQLLLDYQNNKNLIKEDVDKLKSHINTLHNQMLEKIIEAEKLQNIILSINNL